MGRSVRSEGSRVLNLMCFLIAFLTIVVLLYIMPIVLDYISDMQYENKRLPVFFVLGILAAISLLPGSGSSTGTESEAWHIETDFGESTIVFSVVEESQLCYPFWNIYLYGDRELNNYTILFTENSTIIFEGNFSFMKKIDYHVPYTDIKLTIEINDESWNIDTYVVNYEVYITTEEIYQRIYMTMTTRDFWYQIWITHFLTIMCVFIPFPFVFMTVKRNKEVEPIVMC